MTKATLAAALFAVLSALPPTASAALALIGNVSPTQGSSGTFVAIQGENFSSDSRVTFAGVEACTIFLSPTRLGVVVPFQLAADGAEPLPPGIVDLSVDGSDPRPFTVTPLRTNPNPPGAVLQNFVLLASRNFIANVGTIERSLVELKSLTSDSRAQAYLDALRNLVPLVSNYVAGEFQALPSALDPLTLANIERVLLQTSGSDPGTQLLLGTLTESTAPAVSVVLPGDDFLQKRQTFASLSNSFWLAAIPLAALCPITEVTCAPAVATVAIASMIVGVVTTGGLGVVEELIIDSSIPRTPSGRVELLAGSTTQLSASIVVQRKIDVLAVLGASPALALARQFIEAIAALREALDLLDRLAVDLSIDVPLGPPSPPLQISFSKVTASCFPLCGPVEIDSAGLATARDVTEPTDAVWDFRLVPAVRLIIESWVSQGLRFTVFSRGFTGRLSGTGYRFHTRSDVGLCRWDENYVLNGTVDAGGTPRFSATGRGTEIRSADGKPQCGTETFEGQVNIFIPLTVAAATVRGSTSGVYSFEFVGTGNRATIADSNIINGTLTISLSDGIYTEVTIISAVLTR